MPLGIDFSAIQTETFDFPMPNGKVVYALSEDIPFAILSQTLTVEGHLNDMMVQARAGTITTDAAQAAMDQWAAEVQALALEVFRCTPAYAAITAEEMQANGCDTPIQNAIIQFFFKRLGTRYAPPQDASGAMTTPAAPPSQAA